MRKTLLPHMPTLLMISDTDCQTQSGSTLGNVFSQLPYNSFFNKLHHQFRSVPWPTGLSGGDMRDNSAEILFQSFLQKAIVSGFWHGKGCPLSDIVHPAFPLLTMALPNLQCALKDGFGDAVVTCDMPEPCKFPSLDRRQKSFLWTPKGVDLALHPVVAHVLQVGDAEKSPQAHGFKGLDPFLGVSKQGPCFTAIQEDGSDKRLVEHEPVCETLPS